MSRDQRRRRQQLIFFDDGYIGVPVGENGKMTTFRIMDTKDSSQDAELAEMLGLKVRRVINQGEKHE